MIPAEALLKNTPKGMTGDNISPAIPRCVFAFRATRSGSMVRLIGVLTHPGQPLWYIKLLLLGLDYLDLL